MVQYLTRLSGLCGEPGALVPKEPFVGSSLVDLLKPHLDPIGDDGWVRLPLHTGCMVVICSSNYVVIYVCM